MRSFLLFTILVLPGCSGASSDGKVTVSGNVTFNKVPVEKGTITLASTEGNADAGAIVAGRYQLRATPGAKKVSVLAYRVVGERKDDRGLALNVENQFIPKKFNAESELQVTIDGGMSDLNFDLEGDEVSDGESSRTAPRESTRRY